MKIIVFSDSHGDSFKMLEALSREKDGLGYILHLGDHCTDIRYIERAAGIIPAVAVVGNNDHYMAQLEYAEEKILEIYGKRIFMAHGHKHCVKQGFNVLNAVAKSNKCDIALFGHTHTAFYEKINGIHMLNPGSIGCPSVRGNTYALINITEDNITFEIKEV